MLIEQNIIALYCSVEYSQVYFASLLNGKTIK